MGTGSKRNKIKDKVFYTLTLDDIDLVATEEIGRSLTSEEVLSIIPYIEDQIQWYDIIADAISSLNSDDSLD
ncbi:MAG: hypothetical protein R3C61_06925 [Bacteroidia bacterium]